MEEFREGKNGEPGYFTLLGKTPAKILYSADLIATKQPDGTYNVQKNKISSRKGIVSLDELRLLLAHSYCPVVIPYN